MLGCTPVGDALHSLLVQGEEQRADGVPLLGSPRAKQQEVHKDTGSLSAEIQGFCPLSSMTCVLSPRVRSLVSLSR